MATADDVPAPTTPHYPATIELVSRATNILANNARMRRARFNDVVQPHALWEAMEFARSNAMAPPPTWWGGLTTRNPTGRSGYRLAAYCAFALVRFAPSIFPDEMPTTVPARWHHPGGAGPSGISGLAAILYPDYIYAGAINLAEEVVEATENLALSTIPTALAQKPVKEFTRKLTQVSEDQAEDNVTLANQVVPHLEKILESLGSELFDTSRKARMHRLRRRFGRAAAVVAIVATVAATASWGITYAVTHRSQAHDGVTSVTQPEGSTAPAVPNATERVQVIRPDSTVDLAPWGKMPDPIVLQVGNLNQNTLTIEVTLGLQTPRPEDQLVTMSIGLPAGIAFVAGQITISNKKGRNQMQSEPVYPAYNVPLLLDSDTTPTVYTMKLAINERRDNLPPPPGNPPSPGNPPPLANPSDNAAVFWCGLNPTPFIVFVSLPQHSEQTVGVSVPLYVRKDC